MEPTAYPVLSLIPLSAPTADSPVELQSLQNSAILAENASGEPTGMFAALLSQLTAEQPVTAPVAPESTLLFPAITPVIAAEVLPPAGNVLPLPVETNTRFAAELPQQVREALSDNLKQPLLPPAELPQAVQTDPLVSTATHVNLPVVAAPPVAVAVVTKPVLTKPPTLTTTKPLTPDRPAATPFIEQKTVIDTPPGLVITATKEIPVELKHQSNTLQLVTGIAPDGSTAFTTAMPATPQPLSPAPTTAQHSFTLNHPIADARWGESLGQRVIWMTENGLGRAEIRLNPPELGPLNIQVTVANDEAKVAFNVQHGITKELVEAALPRLREMFSSQGIELTDASVSQHSPEDRRQAGGTGDSSHSSHHGDAQGIAELDEIDAIAGSAIIREGLIDTYV